AVYGRDELVRAMGNTQEASSVVDKLVEARLLVTAKTLVGPRIEIVHEVLIRAWPQLTTWRAGEGEASAMLEQLRGAVGQWLARNRDRGLLWRGDAWADLARWRGRWPHVELSGDEAAFLAACGREAAVRRRTLRGAATVSAIAIAAVVAVLAGSQMRA